MSYRDVVISHRPSFYVPLDEFLTPKNDISGQGTGTFSPVIDPYGVVPRAGVAAASANVSSNTRIGHQDYQGQPFTIDLWVSPVFTNASTATLFDVGSNVLVGTDNNRAYIAVRDAGATYYYAYQDIDEMDSAVHITGIFTGKTIVCLVNAVPGDIVTLPQNFSWTGTTTSHSVGADASHVAVFNKISTIEEIAERDRAGRYYHRLEDVCVADGGIYWDPSDENVPMLSETVIDKEDWALGTFFNCYSDEYGRLTIPDQPYLDVYDSSGNEVTPSFTSSRLNLGISTRHARRPAANCLSNSGFAIVGYVRGTTGAGDRWVYTILNGRTGESWGWKVTSAGNVKLVHRQINAGEETLTEYTYDSTIAADQYFIIRYELGEVTLYTGAVNQYSGSDTIQIDIKVFNDSELIVGADWNYAGDGIQYLDYLYLYQYAPDMAALGGNYTSLVSTTLATVYYVLDSDTRNKTKATWEYTFFFPVEGYYETHSVVWEGMRNSAYATYQTNYNSLGYENLTWGRKIPDLPTGSTMGGVGEAQGPVVLKISLETLGTINPYVKNVKFRIYQEDSYNSTNSNYTGTSESYNVAIRGEDVPTYKNLSTPARAVVGVDRLFNYIDVPVKTVELVARITSSDTGEIICLDNNTIPATRNITYNGTQLVNNGFDSLYVNGVLVTSPFAVSQNRTYHIVAISNTAVDSQIWLANHNTGTGNDTRIQLFGLAAYENALTAAQIAQHYQASRGLIVYSPTEYDTLVIAENKRARGYTYAWETAGDTT